MLSSCPDHAMRAFEAGATDYFVMPVTEDRFDSAMARARHQFSRALRGHGRFIAEASERSCAPPSPPRFLVARAPTATLSLGSEVDRLHRGGWQLRDSARRSGGISQPRFDQTSVDPLAELGFIRIARSLLVNPAAVLYAELAGRGKFALTLNCGVCLHTSAAYRDSILRTIPLPAMSKRYGGTAS